MNQADANWIKPQYTVRAVKFELQIKKQAVSIEARGSALLGMRKPNPLQFACRDVRVNMRWLKNYPRQSAQETSPTTCDSDQAVSHCVGLFRNTTSLHVTVIVFAASAIAVLPGPGIGMPPSAAEPLVSFEREIRPILMARCYSCHGEQTQEGDLRLDRRASAFRKDGDGPVVIAGKINASALYQRLISSDRDVRMPKDGKPLPPEQIALFRNWIDQGAVWPSDDAMAAAALDHWSLKPLVRPAVPVIDNSSPPLNPIDSFIRARLAELRLKPSPEADRRTLLRRVTFDLTGLPPTPEELAAFANDSSAGAYDRVVDRLLASPRYGERWARHWMDAVHFAETHGHDEDRPRPNAWPYRDYLIRSFNDDKPYARFVAEQVAGDALFPDDPQATVALGFLAAGPWDESSQMGIMDDTSDKKIAQVLDRDDMITNVISTFTSTTVHCARCHDHKFDPITQADYYALQAVFAGVDRTDRPFDPDRAIGARRKLIQKRRQEIAEMDEACLAANAALQSEVTAVEHEFVGNQEVWTVVAPTSVQSANGSTATLQSDGSLLYDGPKPDKDTYTLGIKTNVPVVTAVQVEVLADASLPHNGPGRQDNGNLHISEFKLLAATDKDAMATSVPIASAFADFEQDGWTANAAIDGKPETAWGIFPQVGQSHAAVFVLREPLRCTPSTKLTVVLEQLHGAHHLIGRPRISLTSTSKPAAAKPLPAPIGVILKTPAGYRSPADRLALAKHLLNWKLDCDLAALPAPKLVYAAAHDFKPDGNFKPSPTPRPVQLLRRGDIHQPMEEAQPGALSCLGPLGLPVRFKLEHPNDEAARRAALAKWLTDPRNPLTWRSIVNRVWHLHFGRGIVSTPNDLGRMGGKPTHPTLIDWLAVEFRESGGSLKRLHRLIVTSAAYRQSSHSDAMAAKLDAENQFLWRMNPTRLDAESIHDAVLQISGKLDLTIGGPSVKQFVETPGIHVTPTVDYAGFDVESPANYRRSVYRFLFRTLPDPFMEAMDCPDASQLAPVRGSSVGPLQALAMLNDRFIVRQSEHTAARLQRISADQLEQIFQLFRFALLRTPTDEERDRWLNYAKQHGLANACRVMFNTSEFLFVL
jgi:hypothetical protein